jgi:GAF domain-containing protein
VETAIYQVAKWLSRRSRTTRVLWGAFVTAVTFYFGRVLSEQIASSVEVGPTYSTAFHATFFIVLLLVVVFLFRLLTQALDFYQAGVEEEKATILHGYKLCDRLTADKASFLEDATSPSQALTRSAFPNSAEEIQNIVLAAYHAFESTYGKASSSEDRIDFEVTFMTKSIEDGKITIPAAANKDGRMPRSMELRKTNPDIYDNSVTADLYRVQSPRIRIVENTDDLAHDYKELYPSQKNRIKSSVVFPILSNRNRLLGTLVVHCDRPNFFTTSKEKYWSDLLEIFAKRIALEVQRLKVAHDFCRHGAPLACPNSKVPY